MGFSQTIKKDSIWLKPINGFDYCYPPAKAGGNSMNRIGL
jgi:hypothetical protein